MVTIFESLNMGCHGEQKKCLHVHGKHMSICARCTGSIIGHILGVTAFFLIDFSWLIFPIGISAMFVMFLDWYMQNKLHWYHNNYSRLVTGIIGSFSFVVMTLKLIAILFF